MLQLFLALSLVSITSIEQIHTEEFIDAVNETYDNYVIEESYPTPYYNITTIIGEKDEEVYYGLSFVSLDAKDYYLRILYKDKLYKLSENSRGDISALALKIDEGETFSIEIFNKNGTRQSLFDEGFSGMRVPTLNEFETLDNIAPGLGSSSLRTVALTGSNTWDLKSIFLVVAISVVLLAAIILFIYYRLKKGMFNEGIRKKDVFDFRAFLDETVRDMEANRSSPIESGEYVETEARQVLDKEEEEFDQTPIFNFGVKHAFDRDIDDESGYDIKAHLVNKGFITEYKLISEEEKNLITVELMQLKNFNLISKNEYLEEMAEIWKK